MGLISMEVEISPKPSEGGNIKMEKSCDAKYRRDLDRIVTALIKGTL
jgi:hypothetical protein